MTTAQKQNPSIQRLEAIKVLQPASLDLWRFYEERADRLGERMWSIGIWLMTVIATTLSLPFVSGLIKPAKEFPYLTIEARVAVVFLALFGTFFSIYSYAALRDLREHIESNWRKSGYILAGTWQADWGGRKSHGWNVLLCVGVLALAAFVGLFLLALFQK